MAPILALENISKRFGAVVVADGIHLALNEGEALGINQSASSMARILGPLAGGMAYAALGTSAPYVGGAIVAGMAFILARGIDEATG